MPSLSADLLARRAEEDYKKILREDLEDALKEYDELDLLIELLQNALDAIDYKRYVMICQAATRDPQARETIDLWNAAILDAVESDSQALSACTEPAQRVLFYQRCANENERRQQWWDRLAGKLGGTPSVLAESAAGYRPTITITVRPGPPRWIEVEDDGVGIADIPASFRHKSSVKRSSAARPRRLGIRGSHGWGLSAVLAMSDRIEIISRVAGNSAGAFAFSNYASFTAGDTDDITNDAIDLALPERAAVLSSRLRDTPNATGTHVRVQLARASETSLLGHTLNHYNAAKFGNLLRLYTPVGQVNDYVLHPAFHTLRKADIDIRLRSMLQPNEDVRRIEFDVFRLSEGHTHFACHPYDRYVNIGWPRNVSVHTINRTKRQGVVFLSAAEIQPADLVHQLEESLGSTDLLPAYRDEHDELVHNIPRGFQLALSGGMRSEYMVRLPRSTTAAFRGVVLAETARPTLGRKYVVDQRQSIAKAAVDHERVYDDVRRKVLPDAVPPPATPAAARWRREFFVQVRTTLSTQPPLSVSLRTWAGRESREARVMVAFGELLNRGAFGDLRILRVHLSDKYDFAFLYGAQVGSGADVVPTVAVAQVMERGGYAVWNRQTGLYQVYGIGEFKASGHDLLSEFNEDQPRKAADTIDLLVCWDFDTDEVTAQSWTVAEVDDNIQEFQGQTHAWIPAANSIRRARRLPVISLEHLIGSQLQQGQLSGGPAWPATLPEVYY